MKKRTRFALGLAMAAMLTCGFSAAAMAEDVPDASGDPEVKLVFAEVNPIDTTIIGQFDAKFAEEVERLSGGSIKIDMQASGVLGAEGDFLEDMTSGFGSIDMARISVSTLTTCPSVCIPEPQPFLELRKQRSRSGMPC